MRQATLPGIGRRWNRRKACFEPRSQLRAIEIAADQHELVGFFPVARILVQAEPLGDKMENVALVAFGDPNQAFGAIDVVRKLLEKVLKFLHGKGPRALKGNGLETVRRQMIAIGGMPAAGVELIAFVICVQRFGRSRRRSGNGEKTIRLEQSDAEDKRKRDPTLGCAHHPRLRLDLPDRGLNPSQPAGANEIALVEQNDVAVTKLLFVIAADLIRKLVS